MSAGGRAMGMLTSSLRSSAICRDKSCMGIMVRMPCRQSILGGTEINFWACDSVSTSSVLQIKIGSP